MRNSFGMELSPNCPRGVRDSSMNGENPLTTRANGFRRFYKLSKGMRVKCGALQRLNFMRGEIVVYQLSDI